MPSPFKKSSYIMHYFKSLFILFFLVYSCAEKPIENEPEETMYFPPNSGTWETMTYADAGFASAHLSDLLNYLETKHTKGFIILKNCSRILFQRTYSRFILVLGFCGQNTHFNCYRHSRTRRFDTTFSKSFRLLGNGLDCCTTCQRKPDHLPTFIEYVLRIG